METGTVTPILTPRLRPYQDEACNAVAQEFFAPKETRITRPLIVLPTGTGKTVIFSFIQQQTQIAEWLATYEPTRRKMLVIAHREELLDQAKDKIGRINPTLKVEVEQATRLASDQADVVVASVQTLTMSHGKRLQRFNPDEFRIVVCDECFPGGTLVDGRPIEDYKTGDLVWSYNHTLGRAELRKLIRTFTSSPSSLVRVHFTDGKSIVCTPGHPFFVNHEYREACRLLPGDAVSTVRVAQRCTQYRGTGQEEGELSPLFLVDRVEVIEQTSDGTFGGLCPGGVVYNLEVEENHNYFASGILVHNCHHAAAPTYQRIFQYFGFLPPDEFQHAPKPVFPKDTEVDRSGRISAHLDWQRQRLAHWDASNEIDRILIGMTATPKRGDNIGLEAVFQKIVYSKNIREMITSKYLSNLRAIKVASATCLDDVSTRAGDFDLGELGDVCNDEDRNSLAVKAYLDYAKPRKGITFCIDVRHANDLADAYREAGVHAASISGNMPHNDRKRVLREFARGQLRMLTNCNVLTEGFDQPDVGVIIHARPTKSSLLYTQMTGRGTRLYPGKDDCLIIDVVDVTRRHKLVTAPELFGLPALFDAKGVSLVAAVKQLEEVQDEYPGLNLSGATSLAQVKAMVEEVNLWENLVDETVAKFATMSWAKHSDDLFKITWPSLGSPREEEHVEIRRNLLNQWELVYLNDASATEVVAQPVKEIADAFKLAESWIKKYRPQIVVMKSRAAAWRDMPATPAQLSYLKKLRAPVHAVSSITKGQASDMIDLYQRRMFAIKGGRR